MLTEDTFFIVDLCRNYTCVYISYLKDLAKKIPHESIVDRQILYYRRLYVPPYKVVPSVVFFLYMSMLYMEFYPSSIFDIEQSNVHKLASDLGISSIFGVVFL